MDISNIDNIELQYLTPDDYPALKEVMISSYPTMPDAFWKEHHIRTLIRLFPEGQAVIKINGELGRLRPVDHRRL